MAYTKYSLTPANNNATPPDGAPEGMLPSAVNDTMRDMMAQIRDVGDGIRGGTYTMTAPVITGGSITGVALSGNTFTNPVITGGSINNTPIGASTANTGAFTTLSATGATTLSGTTVVSGSLTANTFSSSGATITGGSINSTAIGGTTAAAGKFTTLEATGVTTVQAGTVSAPAITTTGDTNTGIFFPAADTIAFTEGGVEAMRIDSSGNVGIGTSSPARLLTVGGNTGTNFALVNGGTSTAQGAGYLVAQNGTNIGFMGNYAAIVGSGTSQDFFVQSANNLLFNSVGATYTAFQTNNTERMRINSSGNVGIGTSSPSTAYRLSLTGDNSTIVGGLALTSNSNSAYIGQIGGTSADCEYWNAANGYVRIGTNNAERMRITSDGNLLVGATSTPNQHRIVGSASGLWALVVQNNISSNPFGQVIQYENAAPNGTGNAFLYCGDSVTVRAEIRSNGGLANYSGNDVNLSDEREKTNIQLAGSYLDKICAIPVKTFNYIDQNLEEDEGLTLGVVAQDVQAVAPELVMESDWSKEKDGSKMRLSIYQTDLQYALMKCIQEQQAMIEELKAEVALLKSK